MLRRVMEIIGAGLIWTLLGAYLACMAIAGPVLWMVLGAMLARLGCGHNPWSNQP